MRLLIKYITGVFIEYLLVVWLGFTALLQIFDFLSNSGEISERFPGSISVLITYSLWRVPEIMTFLLPFAVLMALLLALGRLEKNHEILAFKTAGAPYSYILIALLPSIAVVCLLHYLLLDRAVPYSMAYLETHGLNIEKKQNKNNSGEPLWRRDGATIVRVEETTNDGNRLINISLFERNPLGGLIDKLSADRAIYHPEKKNWTLQNVYTITLDTGQQSRQYWSYSRDWNSNLTPSDFADLSERPEGLHFSQIAAYALGDRTGARPTYYYRTWLFRRLFMPLSSFLMILLAAPVASSLQIRGRNMVFGIAAGFLLGFFYFIADGMALSLGESGALPPIVAAAMPILIFASLGGIALIRAEGY